MIHEPLGDALTTIGFLDAKNANGETILHYAIYKGDDDLAEHMILAGADVNARDQTMETPLYRAVNTDNYKLLKLLLDHGALIDLADQEGDTALHISCTDGDVCMIETLLAYGASVHAENRRGETPLHYSVYQGNLQVVKCIVGHGANINKESVGGTPLFQAISKGFIEIVDYLIDKGADFDLMDPDGGGVDDALEQLQENITNAVQDPDSENLRAPGVYDAVRSTIENVKILRTMAKEGNVPYFIDLFHKGIAPSKTQFWALLPPAAAVSLQAWEDTVRGGMLGLYALHHGSHDLVDPAGPISAYLCEYLVLPEATRSYLK
jgi:Ankyrin repeats (3 copies)/Ankyrin repeat